MSGIVPRSLVLLRKCPNIPLNHMTVENYIMFYICNYIIFCKEFDLMVFELSFKIYKSLLLFIKVHTVAAFGIEP